MPSRAHRISEPEDLRALAHPLRLRLLGALRVEGPATASDLARRLGVSSGLTSYHLRALAERGFVEDDPERNSGRSRWWRAVHDAHEWEAPNGGVEPAELAGRVEAMRALNREVARVYAGWLESWAATGPDLDDRWRGAVDSFDWWMRLTPERLKQLNADVAAVVSRHQAEAEAEAEAAAEDGESERVGIVFVTGRGSEAVP
jgi:DNA-binding transcriptional ArsR family regulator